LAQADKRQAQLRAPRRQCIDLGQQPLGDHLEFGAAFIGPRAVDGMTPVFGFSSAIAPEPWGRRERNDDR
jgi:hypothetical protein